MKAQSNNSNLLDLMTKFLAGECTEAEKKMLQDHLAQNPEDNREFDAYKTTWANVETASTLKEVDVDAEWILFKSKNQIERKDPVVRTIAEPQGLSRKKYLSIAAVILLLLVPLYFILQPDEHFIEAQLAMVSGELPDGSEITLNRNSKIKYNEAFGSSKRKVELEGEAFFQVASDKTKPFIINTGNLTVEVLGTSFYVNAINPSNTIQVIVEEGKVAVYRNKDKSDLIYLNSGNKAEYIISEKRIIKSDNLDNNYLAWKTKKIHFENRKLSYIVKTINKVYGSSIKIASESINNCRMSVIFEDQSFDQVLHVIEETLDLAIEKNDTSIILKGEGC